LRGKKAKGIGQKEEGTGIQGKKRVRAHEAK